MELFVDTAEISEIAKAASWGITGVTTNPSLISKVNKNFKQVISEICKIPEIKSVSAEAVSDNAQGMIREAKILSEIDKKVVVKIPMTVEGIKAVRSIPDVKCNVTLVFSANQALLAAKAGAYYISPFIGRVDDAGQDGIELIAEMVQIKENYGFSSKVLAASIRHPAHVKQAALIGADIATIPFKVLEKMFCHPLSDTGLKCFMDDWNKIPKKLTEI